jgi:hypothetical protein
MEICLCTSNENKKKEILSYIATHFGSLVDQFNIFVKNVECNDLITQNY